MTWRISKVLSPLCATGPLLIASVPAAAADVLVLADGGSEGPVMAALTEAGHTVVDGGLYYEWDGSGLAGIDAVIYLDGIDWGYSLTAEADAALAAYVGLGGRLIMTEWTAWDAYGEDVNPQVTAMMPVAAIDGSYGYGATWTVSIPDHPLAAGLPAQWDDPAGWTAVAAHPQATVVITGAEDYPFLAYRTDSGGPVVHINHSMAYDPDVISADALQLVVNAVTASLDTPCPWDCGDEDGIVGIVDFLELLIQWGTTGTPCDYNGTGVGIVELLDLLVNWGPCPL